MKMIVNGGNSFSKRLSGSAAVIIPQEPAETFPAIDDSGRVADIIAKINHQVAQTLMISFLVIMRLEFAKRLPQKCLTEKDHAINAFHFHEAVPRMQTANRQTRGDPEESRSDLGASTVQQRDMDRSGPEFP